MSDRWGGGRRALLLALALAALSCSREPQPVERTIQVKNRTAVIRVAASDAQHWVTLYGIVQRMMSRVGDILDADDSGSDISRINRIGSDARIQVTHDTFRLLDLARHYAELSGGTYDFTVAPAAYLWGFEGGPVPTNRPAPDVLQAALFGAGARHLSLSDNGAAALTHTQSKISVTSLADAYAADLAIVEAREKGIANAFVQIGDSVRALGVPRAGSAWEAPLADPFLTNGSLGRLVLDGGVAFSRAALRERTVTIGGEVFGHIIDPRTGVPASGTALAVVSGPIAVKCDALAQALIVAGLAGAPAILPGFARCEALIIPDRQPLEIWMTRGFPARVKLNRELQDAVHTIETGPSPGEPVTDGGPSGATEAVPAAAAPAAK